MLKEIVRGQEKAPIVMIEDDLTSSGVPLLRSFLHNMSQRENVKVHLITYEYDPETLLHNVEASVCDAVELHSVQDPLQWHGPASLHIGTDLHEYLKSVSNTNEELCVVIDSVSRPLHHSSISDICRQIGLISRLPKLTQLVFAVHGDLHDTNALRLLKHTSSAVISVLPLVDATYTGLCSVLHKRQSGKISNTKEHYTLGKNSDILESVEYTVIANVLTAVADAQPDPAANLTFNLSLSDKEKRDRSQLVLPYVQDKLQQESLVRTGAEAKIFYQPDDADDFDEEDPDEDLDI